MITFKTLPYLPKYFSDRISSYDNERGRPEQNNKLFLNTLRLSI